jgi:hypothetical protein
MPPHNSSGPRTTAAAAPAALEELAKACDCVLEPPAADAPIAAIQAAHARQAAALRTLDRLTADMVQRAEARLRRLKEEHEATLHEWVGSAGRACRDLLLAHAAIPPSEAGCRAAVEQHEAAIAALKADTAGLRERLAEQLAVLSKRMYAGLYADAEFQERQYEQLKPRVAAALKRWSKSLVRAPRIARCVASCRHARTTAARVEYARTPKSAARALSAGAPRRL